MEHGPIGITADQLLDIIPAEHAMPIGTIGCRVWQRYKVHIEREHLEALVRAGLLTTIGPRIHRHGKSGQYKTQYYQRSAPHD